MTGTRGGRRQLHDLDKLLGILESALERGEDTVTEALALSAGFPAIGPGMAVAAALDAVFAAQAECMSSRVDESSPLRMGEARPVELLAQTPGKVEGGDDIGPMEESEARALTLRIKEDYANLSLLLLRAHEGRAWVALGYRTWERYVRAEFALSRSRSYELLDQGRLRRALHIAIGPDAVPLVSGRVASRLRPVLDDVIEKVRQRVTEESSDPREIASRVVREAYATGHLGKRPGPDSTASTVQVFAKGVGQAQPTQASNLELLLKTIECTDRVSPDVLASFSARDLHRLRGLPLAAHRLSALATAWVGLMASHQQAQERSSHDGQKGARGRRGEELAVPFVRHAGQSRSTMAVADGNQGDPALAAVG